MPETKGHSLQAIDEAWDQKSAQIRQSITKLHKVYTELTCRSEEVITDIELDDRNQSALADEEAAGRHDKIRSRTGSSLGMASGSGKRRDE